MAAEQLKSNYAKTKHEGCIGRDVSVKISVKGESKFRKGTVTVLDPKELMNDYKSGLFLDGANVIEPIKSVITEKGGKDVTELVRMSYLPWDEGSNFNNDFLVIERGKKFLKFREELCNRISKK